MTRALPQYKDGLTTWWRHQMETFSALLALCVGNSPVTVNSPHKAQWRGALMFSLICVLNKRLSKQSWGWWFKTPSPSLWRHCNESSDFRNKNKTVMKQQGRILTIYHVGKMQIHIYVFKPVQLEICNAWPNQNNLATKWCLFRPNFFHVLC